MLKDEIFFIAMFEKYNLKLGKSHPEKFWMVKKMYALTIIFMKWGYTIGKETFKKKKKWLWTYVSGIEFVHFEQKST